jgi:hypothetical protein
LGNGVDQPSGVPVQVVTSPDGGAPFSGVVQLAGVVCALKADTSVWCWNNGTSAQSAWLPAQATEGGFPVYAYAIGKGGDYIDRNGVANLVGSPVPAVYTIACP